MNGYSKPVPNTN